MVNERLNVIKKYGIESFFLLIIFSFIWLGFQKRYVAGLLVFVFIFSLFFKNKREIIFRDYFLIVLLIIFTLNNVISSLLSVDTIKSTLLSLLWFLIIFIPMSYVGFALNRKNEFFVNWIVPVSFVISFIILLYLSILFFHDLKTQGLVFRKYTFYFLGKATTPDTLTMLSGIGYGYLRQKKITKYKWVGFLYLLFCTFGMYLTEDRGGALALLILTVILLSFDYKRLIIYLILILVIVYISLKIDRLYTIRHLFEYLYSKISQERLISGTQLAVFRAAWGMIKDHWLMGVGTNNFSKFASQYGPGRWFAYAHNFILQFWAENGLFGMILGLSIIGLVIYRWLKSWKLYKYKYIALGVGASFIGMLVGNLTNSTIWIISIAIPFWLLAGVLSSIYFIVKEENPHFEKHKLEY